MTPHQTRASRPQRPAGDPPKHDRRPDARRARTRRQAVLHALREV